MGSISFKRGQYVVFHGKFKGKRYTRIRGKAEEDGRTGEATRFKVRIKPGVLKVPGDRIYIVERME